MVERAYRLRWERATLDAGRAAMTADDHRRAFTAFTGSQFADFDRYLARESVDPVNDGVTYRQAARWLTDAEFAELLAEPHAAVTARAGRDPEPGRVPRVIRLITMPGDPVD